MDVNARGSISLSVHGTLADKRGQERNNLGLLRLATVFLAVGIELAVVDIPIVFAVINVAD